METIFISKTCHQCGKEKDCILLKDTVGDKRHYYCIDNCAYLRNRNNQDKENGSPI